MLILNFLKPSKKPADEISEFSRIISWLVMHGTVAEVHENMWELVIHWIPSEEVTVREMIDWKRKPQKIHLVKMS